MQNYTACNEYQGWIKRGDRESIRPDPPPPPRKNHKNIGFLSSNTRPDPLKCNKATKQAFNDGPSTAHQRNTI